MKKKDIISLLSGCTDEKLEKVLEVLDFKNKTEFIDEEVREIKQRYKVMVMLNPIPTISRSPKNDGPDFDF